MKIPEFLAVIFDMDGLVLDTEKTYGIAWQKAVIEMGYEFAEDFCYSLSGLQANAMEQRMLDYYGADFDLKLFNKLSGKYWREYVNLQGIPVKKGFFNLLDILKTKKIPYCLATNSNKENAYECLQLANLKDVFSYVITRDDVQRGKPAPDIFLLAAKILNQPVSKCLVLEDSATGIKAAYRAGCYTAFVPSVFPIDLATAKLANYTLDDMDDLALILNSTGTYQPSR